MKYFHNLLKCYQDDKHKTLPPLLSDDHHDDKVHNVSSQASIVYFFYMNICRSKLMFLCFSTQSGGEGEGQKFYIKIFLFSFNHHFVLGLVDDLTYIIDKMFSR